MTRIPPDCAHEVGCLSMDGAGNVSCSACGCVWQTRRAWYTESAPVSAFRVFVRSALAAIVAQRGEIDSLRRDLEALKKVVGEKG